MVSGAVVRVSYIHFSDDVYGLQRVLANRKQVGGARIEGKSVSRVCLAGYMLREYLGTSPSMT